MSPLKTAHFGASCQKNLSGTVVMVASAPMSPEATTIGYHADSLLSFDVSAISFAISALIFANSAWVIALLICSSFRDSGCGLSATSCD